MFARIFWSGLALAFSIAAFCGLGPPDDGPLFGLLFLLIAAVIWRGWRTITGNSGKPALEGFAAGLIDAGAPHYVVPEVDPRARRDRD